MQPNGGTGAGRFFARHGAARLTLPAALAAVVLLAAAPLALGQSDDFNDGNDTGWTRYSPLTPFGGAATYTFPNGGYRIAAPPVLPRPPGPARAGAAREDVTYSQFYVSADVVDWDNSLDQAFGVLARLSTVGLGTTNGYSFTYSTQGPSIDISRITAEAPAGVATLAIPALDPAQDYRLVFEGNADYLQGSLYLLTDLANPLAVTSGNDATYASGTSGLVVFDNSGAGNAVGANATFDNYLAGVVPEPGGAGALLGLAAAALSRRRRA